MTLGDRIKRERERHGWSQNELSRRAQVRQAQLSEVESGQAARYDGQHLAAYCVHPGREYGLSRRRV